MRTNYCGLVTEELTGQTVTLCGWVNRRRDHGGVIFVDLRDREGYVQVVCDPDRAEMFAVAEDLRNEFCVQVTGLVRARPEGTTNAKAVVLDSRGKVVVKFSQPLAIQTPREGWVEQSGEVLVDASLAVIAKGGAMGAWIGATIYIIALSGVFFYRFYSEKWRHMNIFLQPAAEVRREELLPERENG